MDTITRAIQGIKRGGKGKDKMSDLISRNELIKALKVHFDSYFREDGELLYSDHICTSDDVIDLIKLVEKQPTAYSIDKVVERLNRETISSSTKELIGLLRAIEIVKAGGNE